VASVGKVLARARLRMSFSRIVKVQMAKEGTDEIQPVLIDDVD
jgi:hypothetical protein